MTRIEIPEWINAKTVEHAYGRARLAMRRRDYAFSEKGMRAARAKDPRLLLALEHGTTILDNLADAQHGQTRRDPWTHEHRWNESSDVELTEVALWRNAYESADRGEPMPELAWIYGAAAELAGL